VSSLLALKALVSWVSTGESVDPFARRRDQSVFLMLSITWYSNSLCSFCLLFIIVTIHPHVSHSLLKGPNCHGAAVEVGGFSFQVPLSTISTTRKMSLNLRIRPRPRPQRLPPNRPLRLLLLLLLLSLFLLLLLRPPQSSTPYWGLTKK